MPDNVRPEDRIIDAEIDRAAAELDRDNAMDVAAGEAVNRDIAEADAIDARIHASQAQAAAREMASERNILSHELAYERAASSNSAFGFYLTLAILVAALVVGGFYYYYWTPDRGTVVVNAAPPPPTTVVTPSAPPPPAPAPTTVPVPYPVPTPAPNEPPVVNVQPPDVHNNITITPREAPPPTDTGEDSRGSNNDPPRDSGPGSTP